MNSHLTTILKKSAPASEAAADSAIAPGPGRRRSSADLQTLLATALPWLLVFGFLGMLGVVLGDRLMPARTLPVTTVVSLPASEDAPATADSSAPTAATTETPPVDPFSGPMLFQASGWVEPAPFPVIATALTNGVVETVEVLEGEAVTKGQVLATLINDDAELDVQTARHRVDSLKAQAAAHQQKIAAVQARFFTLEKQVESARSQEDQLADKAQRLEKMTNSVVPEQDIVQANLGLASQQAEVAALAARKQELQAEQQQLTEESQEYLARISEAETDLARAELALERTRIPSPIDGVIAQLLAAPGQKKMLDSEAPYSAAIAVLFDPENLQARIDVPLAEAGKLEIGQPVRLRTNFLPDQEFRGRVTRIVGEADLQRNTLQCKVAIENPDPRLRPEMLCRAEFLAPTPAAGSSASPRSAIASQTAPNPNRPSRVQVFIPENALAQRDNTSGLVWKLDSTQGEVVPQQVELGSTEHEGHLQVLTGLNPGDRVVLDPPANLSTGERVRPAEPVPNNL